MKLKNKYALVTGASTGIGRAIAIELAKEGAGVCLVARREEKLKETQKIIEDLGGSASYVVCDLEKDGAIDELWEQEKYNADPNLDIIVNVAGVWHDNNKALAGITYDDFKREEVIKTMKVGLLAPMLLTHLLIPSMDAGSSIVNITGTFENGARGWLPYYTSKRALEDFTIGLAQDLKEKGIKVNAISPSDTATEEYVKYFSDDAKDANTPEDIAKKVLEIILSDITGQVLVMKQGREIKEGFHK